VSGELKRATDQPVRDLDAKQCVTDLLLAIGARPVKNGRIILHCDAQGMPRKVEINYTRDLV
jgi:hypothetical protein